VILDYRSENGETVNDLKFSDLEQREEHEMLKFHSLMPEILEEGSEREATIVINANDQGNINQLKSQAD
jgi:hypothetical protein